MILKTVFWQLMDRDTGIRIPHPLPIKNTTQQGGAFYWQRMRWDSNNLNARLRGSLARRRLDGGGTSIFAEGENANESLILYEAFTAAPVAHPRYWEAVPCLIPAPVASW